jgi:hypothetical protein
MNQRREHTTEGFSKGNPSDDTRAAATERSSGSERVKTRKKKRRISGFEREQMAIHNNRGFSGNESDNFLWLMLGLILAVTLAALYLMGRLF